MEAEDRGLGVNRICGGENDGSRDVNEGGDS